MKRLGYILAAIATAIIFTVLFYEKSLGLNLVILEWVTIPIMMFLNRPLKVNKLTVTAIAALLLTSLAVLYSHSGWTIFVNILMFFTCNSIIVFKEYRSYMFAALESFRNAALSFVPHINRKNKDGEPKMKKSKIFWLTILAFGIAIHFVILYSLASSKFEEMILNFLDLINFKLIVLFIFGLVFANFVFRRKTEKLMTREADKKETIERKRKKRYFKGLSQAIKNRNFFGVILLGMLNIVLLLFNISDIRYVWFFTWDGSMLGEFIHQGVWILSFTIIISQFITLLIFRGNLNFYSRNRLLKILAIIWLAQNCIMAISVCIRNIWYIKYFGLAFGRIEVFFFLALVIIGLISTIIKISRRKTIYYLFKVNSYSFMVIISLSALINWDVAIADYNFAHNKIDYSFMEGLDDPALPILTKTREELDNIDKQKQQDKNYDPEYDYYYQNASIVYETNIKYKIKNFKERYENQSILEWNYADQWAYRELDKKGFLEEDFLKVDYFETDIPDDLPSENEIGEDEVLDDSLNNALEQDSSDLDTATHL